ncbi:MAG: 4Fe-4S dicluster domain-containing protein [Balneolaceae bacterium]|nr:4Fe-4S dicluster domain-containing protein [Balneolaceae bacterium]
MSVFITDTCINCAACEPECPNQAIYEPGAEWSMAEGTELSGTVSLLNGTEVDADEMQEPLSDEFYFIVPDKCTECTGFHEEEQCIAFCPVPDCIIPDPDHEDSEDELMARHDFLHG